MVLFWFFKTGFSVLTALAILELTLQTKLGLNWQTPACLCFQGAGIKGMHVPSLPSLIMVLITVIKDDAFSYAYCHLYILFENRDFGLLYAYVMVTSLWGIWFANIFSPPEDCLWFHWLLPSYTEVFRFGSVPVDYLYFRHLCFLVTDVWNHCQIRYQDIYL